LIDEIDKIILYSLVENARMSSIEITRVLNDLEYTITERAVRYRLKKLEKDGVILGYSALINPFYINDKINKLLLIKFKIIKDSSALFERLKKYVDDSAFCIYSCKIHGDFDFVCHFILDSNEQFDLEMDSFINQFSDLIADFRTFDSGLIKFNYHSLFNDQNVSQKKLEIYKTLNSLKKLYNINNKFQFIVESLVKYFDATFARIWIIDERKENLILKCSAGKYARCNGKFSKVPVDSNKIGYVFRTKKPAITNDVLHDARIKYPQWAKQENLKSFAGYPLTYNGEPMGVLALFSEKRLKPIEFELIGIFCENVSKELSNFLDDQKFLFTNQPG
jgi:DNA-binding Lrp family transcriptional regulator